MCPGAATVTAMTITASSPVGPDTLTSLEEPTPAPAANPGRSSHRFAPVSRGRGYQRISALPVLISADGTQRLTLGLERVCVAQVTHRASQAPFEVSGGTPAAAAAVAAAAQVAGLAGRCELVLRAPWPRDSGLDVTQAGALAAVNGLLDATETPMTTKIRSAVAAALGGLSVAVMDGFGVQDTRTGLIAAPMEDAPRFTVLLWHRPGTETHSWSPRGSEAAATTQMPSTPVEAAAWFAEVAGAPHTPFAASVAEAAARIDDVYTVLGGRDEHEPVVVLLPEQTSIASAAAFELRARVAAAGLTPAGFVPTFVVAAKTTL